MIVTALKGGCVEHAHRDMRVEIDWAMQHLYQSAGVLTLGGIPKSEDR